MPPPTTTIAQLALKPGAGGRITESNVRLICGTGPSEAGTSAFVPKGWQPSGSPSSGLVKTETYDSEWVGTSDGKVLSHAIPLDGAVNWIPRTNDQETVIYMPTVLVNRGWRMMIWVIATVSLATVALLALSSIRQLRRARQTVDGST